MTDDSRLIALWALDEPPAHDPAFVLTTLDRLARRRFRAEIARLLALVVAATAVCWAVAPAVETLVQSSGLAVAITAAFGLALAAARVGDDGRPGLI
jgi:hypothetical protein